MKIHAVGGYDEIGRNMTVIEVGGEAIILDMGLHLENYIKHTEDEDLVNISAEELISVNAVPNIEALNGIRSKVLAIVPSHAHLDHIGAIPFLAKRFEADVIGTAYTIEVLSTILRDEKISIPNKLRVLNAGSKIKLSKKITLEFINTTHSVPQTVMIAVHTPEGTIIYANDFKFDQYPTLGKKPDFHRLEQLGKQGVKALIVDSTYSRDKRKMPSESVAKQMLKDVMLGTISGDHAVIVTTFSSHIARLASIIEFGKKMGRKIVFLGRSISKYVYAAEACGIVNFSKDVEIVKYSSKIGKRLRQIEKDGVSKYLLVVTGHQGEPKATLPKIVDNKFKFKLKENDHVVFSCTTIPSPINIQNRSYLERSLQSMGIRIFKDIHQSGHAAREDLRDLIAMVQPEHIIPAHGTWEMTMGLNTLAEEMGYEPEKTVHMMRNGKNVEF